MPRQIALSQAKVLINNHLNYFGVLVLEVLVFKVLVFEILVFKVLVFEVLVFEVLGLRFLGLSFPNTPENSASISACSMRGTVENAKPC